MNEEALKYSYDIFKKDGYNGSIEDYNTLMSSNEEALEYSYNLFKDDGYNGEIDDFNSLLGISTQKKNPIKEEEPLESSVEEVSMDAMEEIGAGEEPSKEKSFEELAAQRSSTGVTGYPRYSPQDLGITFTDAFYNAATNQIPAQLKTTWSLNPKTLTVEDYTTAIEKAESEGLDYAEIEETNIPSSFGGAPPQPATRKIVKVPLDEAKKRLAFYRKGAMEDLVDITMDRADASKFVNPNSKLSDGINPKEFMALIGGQLPVLGVSMAPVIGSGTMIYGDIYMENLTAIAAQKNKVEEQEVTPSMMMDVISKGQDEKAIALTGAAIATSLDVIGLGKAFNVIKGPTTGLIRDAVKKGIKEGGRAGAVKALRVAGNVLTTGSVEASTEAMQGVTSQVSKQLALGRTASEAFSNIDSESLVEEGLAGLVMGGGMATMHTPTFSSKEVEAMIEENDLGALKEFTDNGLINWKTIPNSTKSKLVLKTLEAEGITYPTGILGKDDPKVEVDVKEEVDIEEQIDEQTTTDPTRVPSMDEGAEPNVDQVDAEAGLTAEESTDQQEDLIAELNAKRDIELEGAKTKKAQKEINKKYDAELTALSTSDLVSGLKSNTYLDEQSDEDFDAVIGDSRFKKESNNPNPLETNTEEVQGEMNKMPQSELDFSEPELSQEGFEVNPIQESKSSSKISNEEATSLTKPIQYFNGMPMLHTVSDNLAAGVVVDSDGNPMEVEGGLLYNVLGKNLYAAWANVKKSDAENQYANAIKLYESNKDLFDKLWDDGKLPDGHIPMAVMRMGDDAINSNEAMFRWITPAIKKLPESNRKEALTTLRSSLDNPSKKDAKSAPVLAEFIDKNNITTLDELTEAIVVDAKKRAKGDLKGTLSLDNRLLIYDKIFAGKGTKKPGKPIHKALFEGVERVDQSAFTTDRAYSDIGEPSMLRSKKGEVVGVVGVDVKNGGVIEVDHGNYGYGTKGKMIALISNPKNGMDVFPEFKAKASRVYKATVPKKKNVEPKLPSETEVSAQVGGTAFNDVAFRGSRPATDQMTDQDVLVGQLRNALPQVTVAKSQTEFDNIISEPEVRTKVSDGEVVLGLTRDGKIYLNPKSKSLNTPIHEFGHIWTDYLRSPQSGKKGKELLKKGLELVEGTEAHTRAKEMYGDTELAREEALVELIADKGESIIDAAKKSKFKSWLNGLFKYIQAKFSGLKDVKLKDIKNMNLDDFINTGLADLFSGKPIDASFDPSGGDSNVMMSFEKSPSTKSKQFKQWFGDSKVVEPNGTPSLMYHGTKEDFEEFDSTSGIFFTKERYVAKMYSKDAIVKMNEGTETIVPAYLRIESPIDLRGLGLISTRRKFINYVKSISGDTEFNPEGGFEGDLDDKVPVWEIVTDYNGEFYGHLDEIGYDGIYIKDENDIEHESYIVWNANQAKHAAENNGDWSREDNRMRFKKQAESTNLDDATQLRNLLVDNQDLIMNEVVFKKLQENGVSIARVNEFRALARNLVKTTLKLNEKFESEGLNAEQQAKAITEDIKKYSKEVAPLRQFVLTMVKDDKIRQIFQDRDTIKQFYKKGKLGEKWQSVMFMMDPTKINPMTMPKALFDEYVGVINNIAKKLKRGQLYGTDIKMIHDFHENLFKNNEDAEIDYIAESIAPYMDQYEAALADESSDGVDNVFFRNLDKAMLEKGEEVLGEDHKKSFKKNKKQILAIVKSKSVEEGVDELDYDIPAKDQQPMWNVAADAINEYNQKSDEDKLVISAKEFVEDKLNNSKLDNDLIERLKDKDNLEYIFRKGKYHARRDRNIETLLSTIKDIKGLKGDITENIISEREREYARSLLSIEGKNDLLNFEAYEINQITKTLQGVETGLWLPPIALRLRRKIFANNLSNELKTTFDNSGILPILDSFGESIPTFEREVREEIQKVLDKGKSKASLKEFIQKKLADSYGIAQLGKMKTDGLEKLMNRVYSAFETTNFLIKKPRTERANLFLKIKKKTEFNGKKYDREDINILVYMKQLQLQFDSNPNSEYVPNLYYLVKDLKINEDVKYDVNSVSDNEVYQESTAASLWKDFSKKTEGGGDPTLDYKKVNELLSQSNASSYFDFLNKLSTEARSMVQHTVKYSQGKAAEIFTDHVTVRVREDTNKASDIDPFVKSQPVAKAKTSISRQAWKKAKGGYEVKKISWDAYSISSQSFEDQVRDYHLREEYLNVYSALTVLKNNLDGNGQALVGALQLDLEAKMTVASSKVMSMNSAWGSALRLNKKAILSSLTKVPSETLSNLGFAITNPKTFSDAFFGGTKLSPEATAVLLEEYGSAQINRLIDTKFYSEEVADIREDVVVRPKNAVEALDQKLPGLSNASSSIIGLSDKLVANKMWQAHVARKFKELSGIDWDNNIALEPNLRKKYEAEIRDAMAQADIFVTKRWQGNGLYATSVDFTSGGNYDTTQKNAVYVSLMNWFKPFRTGMSSLINESLSQVIPEIPIGKKTYFRTQGYVGRKEAMGNLLGAVGSIMSYGFISKLFSDYLFDAILDALMGEDDDDEPLSVDMNRALNHGLIETALLSTRVGRMNSMVYGMASLTARAVTYGYEADGIEGIPKEIARNFTSGRLSETMLGGHGSLISLASKGFDGKDRSAVNYMMNASFVAARLSGIPFTKEYLEVIKRMYPDVKPPKKSGKGIQKKISKKNIKKTK